MILRLLLALCVTVALQAGGPVYVTLWFDTEDYIEPSSDDAALRLAEDLSALGVRATFKVVGEKARVLEQRGRYDVIRALNRHDIGYHTQFHSIPPAPAVYLRRMGFLDGAAEFERREAPGVADLRRIFGVNPSCYGQPGSSWGPQTHPALRRLGIPIYLDEGSQVGLNDQPFWYGGLLYVFKMGRYVLRADINDEAKLPATLERFDLLAKELSDRGGGMISIFYHPAEFSTTEFWDGVNFSRGANPARSQWKNPRKKTREQSELGYRILKNFVAHTLKNPAVRYVTAREFLQLYAGPEPPRAEPERLKRHLAAGIAYLETERGALSPADMLLALLGLEYSHVDGPVSRGQTTLSGGSVSRAEMEDAKLQVAAFIRTHKRLPAEVWLGSDTLSLADFTATLAADGAGQEVAIRRGALDFEKHFATDGAKVFNWVIHPEGFDGSELLELGRLQGWTLKPARLR